MKIIFESHFINITPSDNDYLITLNDKEIYVKPLRVENGKMDLIIDEKHITAYVSSDGAKRWVTINGQTVLLTKTSGAKQRVRQENAKGLTAPMPGQVRSVVVSVGDVVKKGQTLLTIEAMKMEIRIQAVNDGKVKLVYVKQGQIVEREQTLIEMED